ncbi:unnamed protein product [Boreogadus saida]
MTTYVWLMFYYYIMIVPSQRALFLWVKKNIKSIIYIVLILDSTYKFIFICVMMISCFATAHYLNKHMKSLSASDGSLSNPRLHSQIRVTFTGFLQGVLCFLCGIWNLVYVMTYYLSPYFYFGSNITFTVINLYISGTTVNLGVGQTLFRERAIHVWKAVKKRLCTGKSSKDLRPPGNLVTMTSLSIKESSGVDTTIPL